MNDDAMREILTEELRKNYPRSEIKDLMNIYTEASVMAAMRRVQGEEKPKNDLETFWRSMHSWQRKKNERLSDENKLLWDVSLRLLGGINGEVDGRKITDLPSFARAQVDRLRIELERP